jgi:ssDNA-binding Zn-finger/Zn-ribbon topoisomerase 1
MPSCRICNKPLIWKQPYKKGDRPVEKDGSIHNCSKLQKENVDLKCIICDGSVGCPTCEFIENCKPQDVSPMCICKNCEEIYDSLDSYKKSVIKKFPLLNLKI